MAIVKEKNTGNVPRAERSRDKAKDPAARCLVPGCVRRAQVRGVCKLCRDAQYALKKQGIGDGHWLERGQLLPPAKPGRKPRSPVHRALAKEGLVDG